MVPRAAENGGDHSGSNARAKSSPMAIYTTGPNALQTLGGFYEYKLLTIAEGVGLTATFFLLSPPLLRT